MIRLRPFWPTSALARGGAGSAAAALFGQSLVLAFLAVWSAVAGIGGSGDRLQLTLIAMLAASTGVCLGYIARGLAEGRRWARSPALVWEAIMLPVGVSLAQGIPLAGALLLASAAVVLVGIFAAAQKSA